MHRRVKWNKHAHSPSLTVTIPNIGIRQPVLFFRQCKRRLLTASCQRRQQQGIMSEVVLNAPRHAETYMHTCHKMPRCALELQLNCTLKSSRAKLVPQIWHGCTRHPSQRGDKSLDSRLWLTSPRGAMTSRRSRRRSGSPQQVPERWSACIRCLRWGTRGQGCILRVTSTPT